MKLWSVGDEQTRGYMHVFLISPPSFSSSLTQRAAGNKRGRLTEFFWSQQWNICFNSFILGLQVGMLNRIQSNVVGKPMCVCVCVCVRAFSRSAVSDSLQPHGLSLPGPSSQGIFQAQVLEWAAILPWDGSCVPASPVSTGGFSMIELPALLVTTCEQTIRTSCDGQGKGVKTAWKGESHLNLSWRGEDRKGLAAPELLLLLLCHNL